MNHKFKQLNDNWNRMYEYAKVYYDEHGNLEIPEKYQVQTSEGEKIYLGIWINRQRQAYKNKTLNEDRINKLNELGIKWSIRNILSWEEMYEYAKKYYEKYGNLEIPARYQVQTSEGEKINLGSWITNQRQAYKNKKLNEDRINKLNELGIKWSIPLSWEEMYEYAKEYYDKHGNLEIPAKYQLQTSEGEIINLGIWINRQRQAYKNKALNEDKINKLNELCIKWSIILSWEEMYEYAKVYYAEHGNLEIPVRYQVQTSEGEKINLGKWIKTQRQTYKNNTINEDRINKLKELGIKWSINNVLSWEEMYEYAKEYYEKHGNLEIPASYQVQTSEGEKINLGSWITTQRQTYKNNTINEDRINKLKELGIKWSINNVLSWEEMYEYAKKYYEKYGNLEIPQTYSIITIEGEKIKLGIWINNQRRAYKNNTINEGRINKLNELGIKWSIRNILSWEEMYEYAKEYYEKHGNLEIPQTYSIITTEGEKINLGTWIRTQRQSYKQNKLEEEKINKLNELGMRFYNLDVSWEEMYEEAQDYFKNNRSVANLIDRNYEEDEYYEIGKWLRLQRYLYNKGINLSEEQRQKLEKISINNYQDYYFNISDNEINNEMNRFPSAIRFNNNIRNLSEEEKYNIIYDNKKDEYNRNFLTASNIDSLNRLINYFVNGKIDIFCNNSDFHKNAFITSLETFLHIYNYEKGNKTDSYRGDSDVYGNAYTSALFSGTKIESMKMSKLLRDSISHGDFYVTSDYDEEENEEEYYVRFIHNSSNLRDASNNIKLKNKGVNIPEHIALVNANDLYDIVHDNLTQDTKEAYPFLVRQLEFYYNYKDYLDEDCESYKSYINEMNNILDDPVKKEEALKEVLIFELFYFINCQAEKNLRVNNSYYDISKFNYVNIRSGESLNNYNNEVAANGGDETPFILEELKNALGHGNAYWNGNILELKNIYKGNIRSKTTISEDDLIEFISNSYNIDKSFMKL